MERFNDPDLSALSRCSVSLGLAPQTRNLDNDLLNGVATHHDTVVMPMLRSMIPESLLGLSRPIIAHTYKDQATIQRTSGRDFSADYLRVLIFVLSNNMVELERIITLPVMWGYLRTRGSVWLSRVLREDNGPTASELVRKLLHCAIVSGDANAVDSFLKAPHLHRIARDTLVFTVSGYQHSPLELSLHFGSPEVTETLLKYNIGTAGFQMPPYIGQVPGVGSSIALLTKLVSLDAIASPDPNEFLRSGYSYGDGFLRQVLRFFGRDGMMACLNIGTDNQRQQWAKRGGFHQLLCDVDDEFIPEIIDTMVEANVGLGEYDYHEGYVIEILARRGQLETIRRLLITRPICLPQHIAISAAQSGKCELVDYLVTMGVDLFGVHKRKVRSTWETENTGEAEDKEKTAYSESIRLENAALIAYLEGAGVITQMNDSDQWTAAWCAAVRVGNPNVIDKLLSRIDHIRGFNGAKSICGALKQGREDLAMALLSENHLVKLTPGQVFRVVRTALENKCLIAVRAVLERDFEFEPLAASSSLDLVVSLGDTATVESLLNAGASFGERCSKAMYIAVRRGDTSMVKTLLKWNGVYNWHQTYTPLSAAARNRDQSMAIYLLGLGADPRDSMALEIASSEQREFLTPDLTGDPHQDLRLQHKTEHDTPHTKSPIDMAMVHLLVSHFKKTYSGGDNEYGSFALQSAICDNRSEVYDYLIDHRVGLDHLSSRRVNISKIYADKWTPLAAAIHSGKMDIVRKLLQAGVNPNGTVATLMLPSRAKERITPLLYAISTKDTSVLQLLIDHGALVNFPAVMRIKRTPLQKAAEVGDIDLVQFLLNQGADINAPPAFDHGATALQQAAISGWLGVVDLLLRNGAHVNAPGAKVDGRTALEGAAEHGRLDTVQLLIDAGAGSGEAQSEQLQHAMEFAQVNGHIVVSNVLSDHCKSKGWEIKVDEERLNELKRRGGYW